MTTAIAASVISHVCVVTVHVSDQDEALKFYTEILGFEKRTDVMMGESMRWLTVIPAGSATEITLISGYDSGAPLGGNTGIVLETADIDAAYRHLSARGVKFTELPVRHPWGGWAQFTDPDGNTFGLHSNQLGG